MNKISVKENEMNDGIIMNIDNNPQIVNAGKRILNFKRKGKSHTMKCRQKNNLKTNYALLMKEKRLITKLLKTECRKSNQVMKEKL